MSQDLRPLLEFWGLKEGELNREVFLSASSTFSCRRRLARTVSYPEFATSSSKVGSNGTTDGCDRTLQRYYDEERLEEDCMKKSTRVAGPHVSEEPSKAESCGYDPNTMEGISATGMVCVNCAHHNVGGLNWCPECGTAVNTGTNSHPLLNSSKSRHSQSPTQNSKSTHQFDVMPIEFHSDVKSCLQLSAKQYAANLDVLREVSSMRRCTGEHTERRLVRSDSNHSRRKLVFSVKSPGQCTNQIQASNVRFWSTSGLYMWRKPSSLKSVESSPCDLAEPDYQTNSSDSLHRLHNKVRNVVCA